MTLQEEELEMAGDVLRVNSLWNAYRSSLGWGGMDVAAYIAGGMSIWPCGLYFQEGGRDGFSVDSGTAWCACIICSKVRKFFRDRQYTPGDDDPFEVANK